MRLLSAILTLSLLGGAAAGATQTTTPGTAAQTTPAAPAAQSTAAAQNAALQKALTDAGKIKDPDAKIAALRKVAESTTPTTFTIAIMARTQILETLAKDFPTREDQIRSEADQILKTRNSPSMLFLIAKTLYGHGVMLTYAEDRARKALDAFEAEAASSLAQDRAKYKSMLGLIYARNGRLADADTLLRETAVLDAQPKVDSASGLNKILDEALAGWSPGQRQAAVAIALAETSEKKGDLKSAANALADASMLAPMKSADHKRLEDLYRKTHNGSLDGLEEELDAKYRKANPLPFKADPYTPAPGRTNRIALAELFTGSACAPCIAADLAFDALLQRFGRQDLAVLVYHEHIPAPDPMTNPSTIARAKAYGINSTPSYFIDGGTRQTGGGDRSGARGFFSSNSTTIEKHLTTAADANITLTATAAGGAVKVRVTADPMQSASPDLRLHIALVENELSYTGENGIRFHPMVVRQLAGEEFKGFAVAPGKSFTVEHNFDIAAVSAQLEKYIDDFVKNPPEQYAGDDITFGRPMHSINRANLSVVAFVQDEKTKAILQTAYAAVPAASNMKKEPPQTADPTEPVTWAAKAQPSASALTAGGVVTIDVTAKIARGWHLYALTPMESGPRPTRITIVPDQGFELGGTIGAPEPVKADDPNFGMVTETYEDTVVFAVPVRVLAKAAAGKRTATVQVRFQTCSDKLCLPPTIVKLPVLVEIARK